jgi:PST family polysaccharide transporter
MANDGHADPMEPTYLSDPAMNEDGHRRADSNGRLAGDVARPAGEQSANSLRDDVRSGLRWSFASQLCLRLVSLLSGIVMVRILGPSQFGIAAFALAISAVLISVNDLGQVLALLRWPGEDVDRAARTSATLAISSSLLLYGACFLAAPALASLTGHPEAAGIIRLMTLVVAIDGWATVPRAVLLRGFRQSRLAIAELIAVPVNAAVAVGLAVGGAGAWAIAAGMVSAAVVTAGLELVFCPKIPLPGFNRRDARQLLNFGVPLAGTTFVELLLLNVDSIIVGSLLGTTALGFYALAFNISSWPSSVITQAVRRVSIAGFSRLADDPDRGRTTFTSSFVTLGAVLLPVCAVLAVLARPLIAFLYGEEKIAAATALQWLAVLGGLRVAMGLVFDYLVGLGRSRTTLRVQTCWLLAVGPGLLLGASVDGIRGAAIAHVIVSAGFAAPLFLVTLHRTGVDLADVGRRLLRPGFGLVLMIAGGLLLSPVLSNPLPHLLVAAPTMLALYAIVGVPPLELRRLAGLLPRRGTH